MSSPFCRSDQHTWSPEVVGYRKANGLIFPAQECTTCGHVRTLLGIPMTQEQAAELRLARDRVGERPPCERCGALGTELHHWAPRDAFGAVEADGWPTSWLCRPCHQLWHRTMNRWRQA